MLTIDALAAKSTAFFQEGVTAIFTNQLSGCRESGFFYTHDIKKVMRAKNKQKEGSAAIVLTDKMRTAGRPFSCPVFDNASASRESRNRTRGRSTVEGSERVLETGHSKETPCFFI